MTAGKAREAEPETEWTGKVLFAERREKVACYKIWTGTCVRGCTDVESTCRSPQVKLKAQKKKVQERDIKVQKKADIKGRCVVRAFCGK